MSNIVIQLKVILKGIRPPIWRRIVVPESYTFYQLHVVLQIAMGWKNRHLHSFLISRGAITGCMIAIGTVPSAEEMDEAGYDDLDEKETLITNYLRLPKDKVIYQYDFGDNWEHEVLFEKSFPADPTVRYPICVKGKRACPPEDCGGPEGYYEVLEFIKDPTNPENHDKLQWLRQTYGDFYPNVFQPPTIIMPDL